MRRAVMIACTGLLTIGCGKKEAEPAGKPEVSARPTSSQEQAEQEAELAKLRAAHPKDPEPEPAPEPEPIVRPKRPPPAAAEPEVDTGPGPDLATWKVRRIKDFGYELASVVRTKEGFVTVGEHGAIYFSESGQEDWQNRVATTEEPLRHIARASTGTWVVAGPQGYHANATDGSSWQVDLVDMKPQALLALGSRFVVVGRGKTWTSSDGHAWEAHELESIEADVATVAADGTGVIMSYRASDKVTTVQTTKDGISWDTILVEGELVPQDVAFGRGRYWVVTTNPRGLFASSDLINWAELKLPGREQPMAVAASDSAVVVVGRNGFIATSADGEKLTLVEPPTPETLNDVACGPHACVAVGSRGRIVSTDTLPATP